MSEKSYHDGAESHRRYIKQNFDTIAKVPRYGVWSLSALDLPNDTRHELRQRALKANVIEVVDTYRDGTRDERNLYQLTRKARDYLEDYDESLSKGYMPCGHTSGFVTGSEYLACKECGGRFTKEEVLSARGDEREGERCGTVEHYSPEKRIYENKDWLYEEYWGQFKSRAEIADEIGVTPRTISRQLKYLGIPRRVRGYTRENTVSPFRGFYNEDPSTTDAQSRTVFDPDHEPEREGEYYWEDNVGTAGGD